MSVDAQHLAGTVGAGQNSVRPRTRLESDEPSPAEEQEDPIDDAEPVGITHTVRPGETLSSIALLHLGGSGRYSEVFELNRELLASPDSLQIGMELKIPPKSRPRSLAPVNDRPRSGPTQIADSRADRHVGDRIESHPARDEGRTRPLTAPSAREPEPTLAEPFLPTTAIPAAVPSVEPPATASGSAPARRGAASVGASLRNRRSDFQ